MSADAAAPTAASVQRITIVIADDHRMVRAGLRMLLEAEEDFTVVSEAGDLALTERRVAAYVLKEAAESELIQAVRLAAEGRTYLDPELGARLAAELPASPGPPGELSGREVEVLRLIALGHTNGEIASQLYLSVRTVESHRARIQQKTQRTSRAQLVAYAREHELL